MMDGSSFTPPFRFPEWELPDALKNIPTLWRDKLGRLTPYQFTLKDTVYSLWVRPAWKCGAHEVLQSHRKDRS